jgi:hypothetical protein
MNTYDFFSQLRNQGIKLSVNGKELDCYDHKGTVTPAWRAELTERKLEILTYRHETNATVNPNLASIPPQSRLKYLKQLYIRCNVVIRCTYMAQFNLSTTDNNITTDYNPSTSAVIL